MFGCPLSTLWVPRQILVQATVATAPIQVMIHTALVTITGPWPIYQARSMELPWDKILFSNNSKTLTITQLYPALQPWEMQVNFSISSFKVDLL